jgi:hypothetical protein
VGETQQLALGIVVELVLRDPDRAEMRFRRAVDDLSSKMRPRVASVSTNRADCRPISVPADADASTWRNHRRGVSAANINATRIASTFRREVDFSI